MPDSDSISRDYGRRLYVGNRPYRHKMAMATHSARDWASKQKHSESKKPYREPDIPYDMMEYQWDPWDPTWPRPPSLPPVGPNDPGDPGNPPTRWEDDKPTVDDRFMGCEFYRPISPAMLSPGEVGYAQLARRDDPVVRIDVQGPGVLLSGSNSLCTAAGQKVLVGSPQWGPSSPECTVIVKAKESLEGFAPNSDGEILIVLVAHTASGRSCSTSAAVGTCPSEEAFEWDYDISATTINRNGQSLIKVKGGRAPYFWSISGTGYTLAASKTNSQYNYVIAGASACGKATVTVEDSCGEEVGSGLKEPTYGVWQDLASCSECPFAGEVAGVWQGYGPPGDGWFYGEQDGYFCQEAWENSYAGGGSCDESSCSGMTCNDRCDTYTYCQGGCGCSFPLGCMKDTYKYGYGGSLGYSQITGHCYCYDAGPQPICRCRTQSSKCQEWVCP